MKTKTMLAISSVALMTVVLTAFVRSKPATNPAADKGVDLTSMDKSKDPKNDFFDYANGNWLKQNPIPAAEGSWGAFNELAEKNRTLLKSIIEEAAASKNQKGTIKQKVGDYYAIAMDTLKLEREGMMPIKEDMDKISKLTNVTQMIQYIAYTHSVGMGPLFNFGVQQDMKKSDEYICYLAQGGLGLPDRDYYLKDDADSKKTRDEYVKHIIKMFQIAGKKTEAEAAAKTVMNIETELAKVSMTKVELRDDEKQYHKMMFNELTSNYPNLFFQQYFAAINVQFYKNVIVTQPDFFARVNVLMNRYSLDEWKTYLTWNLLNESADKLNGEFERQNFYFYSTVLQGVKQMRPRWKRMVASTNAAMGEAVGQLYVEKVFSPEAKKRVNNMVDHLMEAYKERIQSLDWMGEDTKAQALKKLATFNRKLCYPDKWKDYTALDISRDSYYKNFYAAQYFEFKRMVDKLGHPIDKSEWGMSPQTVNAYYNPQMNEIVFPAAIMQPPFFNPQADDAVNYGAMGSVIGHEITHGFDDQGSKYDEEGNLKDWWTGEDRKKFNEKTEKLVKQFNSIQVADGLNINGELTLGENIADLGGLTMAYSAYKKSLNGGKAPVIDGMTGEQRFFVGWAQAWRSEYRPETLRQQILTNPHAPGFTRAVSAPSNMEEFYDAFDVKTGNKMFRDESERVKVW